MLHRCIAGVIAFSVTFSDGLPYSKLHFNQEVSVLPGIVTSPVKTPALSAVEGLLPYKVIVVYQTTTGIERTKSIEAILTEIPISPWSKPIGWLRRPSHGWSRYIASLETRSSHDTIGSADIGVILDRS